MDAFFALLLEFGTNAGMAQGDHDGLISYAGHRRRRARRDSLLRIPRAGELLPPGLTACAMLNPATVSGTYCFIRAAIIRAAIILAAIGPLIDGIYSDSDGRRAGVPTS